jgi:ribonuclease P protein component
LLRPAEFKAVFEGGSRHVGRCMVMWVKPVGGGRMRLGLVTSKRALRRAVDRNAVRRRFRECFRKNRLRFAGGADMVLVGRTAALGAPYTALEREMLRLAGKAGLLAGGVSVQ